MLKWFQVKSGARDNGFIMGIECNTVNCNCLNNFAKQFSLSIDNVSEMANSLPCKDYLCML